MNALRKAVAVLASLANGPEEAYEKFKELLAEILGNVDPLLPYGTKLFDALARLTVTTACEAVAIRRRSDDGTLEIFLRRREMDDSAYPGEWHAPGSAMRPGESFADVFARLELEFGGKVTSFNMVDCLNVPEEQRGHYVTPIFLVEIEGEGRKDDTHGWYRFDALPEPMVGHHVRRIFPVVIKAFEEREALRW